MSQLERLKALFDEMGIAYDSHRFGGLTHSSQQRGYSEDDISFTFTPEDSATEVALVFDAQGKFKFTDGFGR